MLVIAKNIIVFNKLNNFCSKNQGGLCGLPGLYQVFLCSLCKPSDFSLTRRHSLGNCELCVLWSPCGVTVADVTWTAGMSTSAPVRLSATVWASIIDILTSGTPLF